MKKDFLFTFMDMMDLIHTDMVMTLAMGKMTNNDYLTFP